MVLLWGQFLLVTSGGRMRVGWGGWRAYIQKSSLPTSRGIKKAHLGLMVLRFGGPWVWWCSSL